jgi:hypothetical protein
LDNSDNTFAPHILSTYIKSLKCSDIAERLNGDKVKDQLIHGVVRAYRAIYLQHHHLCFVPNLFFRDIYLHKKSYQMSIFIGQREAPDNYQNRWKVEQKQSEFVQSLLLESMVQSSVFQIPHGDLECG